MDDETEQTAYQLASLQRGVFQLHQKKYLPSIPEEWRLIQENDTAELP